MKETGIDLFEIPSDFRVFMKQVVEELDAPEEESVFLDAEDAFQNEVGYGGRFERSTQKGQDLYRFHYITSDGLYKWELVVREAAVRSIAGGALIDLEGTRHELVRTTRRQLEGDPLLIWGEYSDDALRIKTTKTLIEALDSLHAAAEGRPRMLRLWTAADDQVVVVVWGDRCALYVVESLDGYATSTGDQSLNESFECHDHDGRTLQVPLADCIGWDRARNALINFVNNGNLGPEVPIEGRIPSQLLMMGDVNRQAALDARAEPPKKLARSSLPRMSTASVDTARDGVVEPMHEDERTLPVDVPFESSGALQVEQLSAWAKRLIEVLYARELIELGKGSLDEITYQLGGLLQAHGIEAEHSIDTAEWLANEIGAVRGISKLFATGGDLQIALRRSREG